MNNMSDGKSNGVVIMYCKDGVIYPVGLKKDQLEMLDLSIGIALEGGIKVFSDKPQGKVDILK